MRKRERVRERSMCNRDDRERARVHDKQKKRERDNK